MRARTLVALAWLVCAACSSPFSTASDDAILSPPPDAGAPGADAGPCDPTAPPSQNGCATEARGVFVSPNGSDTSGDGTRAHPFATLRKAALAAIAAGQPRVFACAGTYTRAETLDATTDGVSAYGGLDCASWAYTGAKAEVAPTTPGAALTIDSLKSGVTLEDFAFTGAPAQSAGESSFGVVVNASAGVTLRRCSIRASDAQKGADGDPGVNSWSGTALGGNDANGIMGGKPQTGCSCGGSGGYGGNAGTWNASTEKVASPGVDGDNGTVGALMNGGTGAKQGPPTPQGNPTVILCTPGTVGSAGTDGTGGAGSTARGSIDGKGWSNAVAGTGANGTSGSAGQGGGGGGGGLYDPTGSAQGGAAGGACGGCGGASGRGGAPGGSSIALVSVSSIVTLDGTALSAGSGGAGGRGGDGQRPQDGGAPGKVATDGCNGGRGGSGGTGGAGGGGAGGHSIASAFTGNAPTEVSTVTTTVAPTAAPGGQPGNGIAASNGQGAAGIVAGSQSF